LKHGEAVGYGMIAAARISTDLGRLSKTDCRLIEGAIASIKGLPPLRGLKASRVLDAMGHDKKVRDGAIHFVLPVEIGRVEITPNVPLDLVRTTVQTLINESISQR
jgi:3-dehydroquinate synthase